MSCVLNPISMTNTCPVSSSPALFTGKSHHQQLSIPIKPVKLHLYISFNSLSLRNKYNSRSIITFVATQQENDQELILENENQENQITVAGDVELSEDAKVYVGNLPFDIDSEKLAHLFEPAGFVEISEVIYNRETDQSRGFGFVTMSTVEEAEKAVDMFHQYEIGGRNLTVNKAAPKGSKPERRSRSSGPSYKLYVKNQSYDMDNERLEQVFEKFGKVVDARVIYDRETGRSRGFGFVTMSSESEMNDAIQNLYEKDMGGRPIKVNVAEDRRKSGSF